jgi:hypothetical protein
MMPDGDTAAHLREQVGGLFFTPEVGGGAVIALMSGGAVPPIVPIFCGMVAIGSGVALAHPQVVAALALLPAQAVASQE